MRPLTRRSLFGFGAVGLVSAGAYGRYAVDGAFEEHVSNVVGVPLDSARALTVQARSRLGEADYDTIAAAFLASTTAPGRWVLPRSLRRDSVHAFLSEAVPDSHGNLVLMGLMSTESPNSACAGLLR